jgi:hypothetical protein
VNKFITTALTVFALILGLYLGFAPNASAQTYVPTYSTWQPQWDQWQYDHRHVVLGRVLRFWPYRVVVQRPDGNVQTIDLKPGTVIHPIGATPMHGDRIAVYGYYSNGTFIANGLVLR